MGLEIVRQLIELRNKFNLEIYIINRGRCYWNSKFYTMIENKNFVKHYKADRENNLEFCDILDYILSTNLNLFFDHIIDFSCYNKENVTNILTK